MTAFETISIILQVLISIFALGTLIVYYRQLRVMSKQLTEMHQSSRAQSGLALADFLQNSDVREARHCVREQLSKIHHSKWTAKERQCASLVTANYDVAAALIRAGLAPVELISTNWGPSIRHCYEILKPFIEATRNLPGSNQQYWSNFEWLYKKSSENSTIA